MPCPRQCTQNMEECVLLSRLRFLYHDLTGRMIKRSAFIGEDTVLFQLLLDAVLVSVFSDPGDHSAACNLTETQVDERMQQLIDMEDPDVIVDLCHHNHGTASKYDIFWDECAKFLNEDIGTAVND